MQNCGGPDLCLPNSWAEEAEDPEDPKDKVARKIGKASRKNAKRAENQAEAKARTSTRLSRIRH